MDAFFGQLLEKCARDSVVKETGLGNSIQVDAMGLCLGLVAVGAGKS